MEPLERRDALIKKFRERQKERGGAPPLLISDLGIHLQPETVKWWNMVNGRGGE
jgi:hypothetical protein